MSDYTTTLPNVPRKGNDRRGYFLSSGWRANKKLGINAVALLAYLWTCDGNRNETGFFLFSLYDALRDLPLSERQIKAAMKKLEAAGLVAFDPEEEVILLKDYMVSDQAMTFIAAGSSEQRPSLNLKGAVRRLAQLPETKLLPLFIEEAKKHAPAVVTAIERPELLGGGVYTQDALYLKGLLDPLTPLTTPLTTPDTTNLPMSSEYEYEIETEVLSLEVPDPESKEKSKAFDPPAQATLESVPVSPAQTESQKVSKNELLRAEPGTRDWDRQKIRENARTLTKLMLSQEITGDDYRVLNASVQAGKYPHPLSPAEWIIEARKLKLAVIEGGKAVAEAVPVGGGQA